MSHNRPLVFVVNEINSFRRFRYELIKSVMENRFQVELYVQEGWRHHRAISEFEALGVSVSFFRGNRGSYNPLSALSEFLSLRSIVRKLEGKLVVVNTSKLIILWGLAIRCWGSDIKLVGFFTGLGYWFTTGRGRLDSTIALVIVYLLKQSLAKASRIICHNWDDARELRNRGICVSEEKLDVVPGSGVDTNEFLPTTLHPHTHFVFAARLLRDKGLEEFIKAAEKLEGEGVIAHYKVFGDEDPDNRSAFTTEELRRFRQSGVVEFLGFSTDPAEIFRKNTCFVLPSYREGLSRAGLEALASGLPIIVFDVPGCRDLVDHLTNGFVVRQIDSDCLATGMKAFHDLSHADKCKMGRESRRKAIDQFELSHINRKMKNIFSDLVASD